MHDFIMMIWNTKCPKRYDSGAEPHVFSDAKDYFKQLYHEACSIIFLLSLLLYTKETLSIVFKNKSFFTLPVKV